jgi:hypothetical protein
MANDHETKNAAEEPKTAAEELTLAAEVGRLMRSRDIASMDELYGRIMNTGPRAFYCYHHL